MQQLHDPINNIGVFLDVLNVVRSNNVEVSFLVISVCVRVCVCEVEPGMAFGFLNYSRALD